MSENEMWGFQEQYRFHAELMLKGLFERIGCDDLGTDVFLVGVRHDGNEGAPLICIEPDSLELQPEDLANVVARARELHELPGNVAIEHPTKWHYEEYMRSRYCQSVRIAISEAIRDASPDDAIVCCSMPSLVEKYLVSVVVIYAKELRDLWPHLQKATYQDAGGKHSAIRVDTCLIDSLIERYLEICATQLSQPNPGKNILGEMIDEESVIRSAARGFTAKASLVGDNFLRRGGLFDNCNAIAKLKYEGSGISGAIIIARDNHSEVERSISFLTLTPLTNHRAVRKLLELCNESVVLLSDAGNIVGMGRILDTYNAADEDVFKVVFRRGNDWELQHNDKVLMRTQFGVPRLPQRDLNEQQLKDTLSAMFKYLSEQQREKLLDLANTAVQLGKGATVVISEAARDEAKRLHMQCTPVEQFEMTASLLRQVASIDGAILLSPDSTCYAIGVILDGLANEKGDSARGSRYNSALRYLSKDRAAVILVVSEDGMIDIIPEVKPRNWRQLESSPIDA